jgi:hypothetical protein
MTDADHAQPSSLRRRLWVVIPFSLWVFVLAGLMLSFEEVPLDYAVRVTGPAWHLGRGPLELRIGVTEPSSRRPLKAFVRSGRVDGAADRCQGHDGAPLRLTVTPVEADVARRRICFDVLVGEVTRAIEVDVAGGAVPPEASARVALDAPRWSAEAGDTLIELFPLDQLASGTPQELWIRVLGPEAEPRPARVQVAGEEAATDRFGVAHLSVKLPPMKGALPLAVTLDGQPEPVRAEVRFTPSTRPYTLGHGPLLTESARALPVHRSAWVRRLYCDLYQAGAHVAGLSTEEGALRLPPLPPGLTTLRCSDDPGADRRGVQRVVLEDGGRSMETTRALVDRVDEASGQAERQWLRQVRQRLSESRPEDLRGLSAFLLSRLDGEAGAVEVLATTLAGDLAARKQANSGRKFWVTLLLTLSFAGVLIWAVVVVLRDYRQLKARSTQLAIDEDLDDFEGLHRRGLPWTVLLLLIIIVLAIGGLLWLLDLVTSTFAPRF